MYSQVYICWIRLIWLFIIDKVFLYSTELEEFYSRRAVNRNALREPQLATQDQTFGCLMRQRNLRSASDPKRTVVFLAQMIRQPL